MKTIGLIGGMSWESSLEYYRIINEKTKQQLGGLHSAKCVMVSVDFHEIEQLQHNNRWDELTQIMVNAGKDLENANADMILICTNTMHKMADDIEKNCSIPLIHIADQTGKVIIKKGLNRVALLGTKFTMEMDFYKGRLKENFGIEVLIPTEEDRDFVHNVIYNELVVGECKKSSRERFVEIIKSLELQGAQGVILGCTEIPLLIDQEDVDITVFDTTLIHAESAVLEALKN